MMHSQTQIKVSAKFILLKNVGQTGTLGHLKELYELHSGCYNTSVCCCVAVDVYVSAYCKLHFIWETNIVSYFCPALNLPSTGLYIVLHGTVEAVYFL